MDASEPLKNARHETFAQAVSKGAAYDVAWAETFLANKRISNKNSLRSASSRVAKRENVQARIQHLRREAKEAVEAATDSLPSTYTKEDIIALYLEISEVLEKAYEAAKARGFASTQQMAKIRMIWAASLARQGKLDTRTTNVIEPNPEAESLANRINACLTV